MADHDTWECQGRQEHGYFGNGTCPEHARRRGGHAAGAHGNSSHQGRCLACDVEHVARAAVGLFPAGTERKTYENWLDRGGLALLQKSVAAWEDGSFLMPEGFTTHFFGPYGSDKAGSLAHDLATTLKSVQPGAAGDKARQDAAGKLVDLIRTVRQESVSRVLSQEPLPFPALYTEQNITELAALIETEAGGRPGHAAQIAVAFTVLNRMRRNATTNVHDVWHGYRHGKVPQPASIDEAKLVLSGTIPDPTGGATHFYSPDTMPKEGGPQPVLGDIGGGLEQVKGVERHGKAVKNYRPTFTLTFIPRAVQDVDEKYFKFYEQPGSGRVR